jgi:hypothetical protein
MDSAGLEPPFVAPPGTETILDAMADAHVGVMVDIVGLEREATAPTEGRAGRVVGRVLDDLRALRDAAGGVVADATLAPLAPLFEPGAPAGVYLTGLLLWSGCVAQAMRGLVRGARAGKPPWVATQRSLSAAHQAHLPGLVDDSLSHLEELCRKDPAAETLVSFQRDLRALILLADRLGGTLREGFTLVPTA